MKSIIVDNDILSSLTLKHYMGYKDLKVGDEICYGFADLASIDHDSFSMKLFYKGEDGVLYELHR